MRRVLVDRLQDEAVLAQDLVDARGVTLLRRGQPISPGVADRLRRLGIAEALVMDPSLAALDLRPPHSADTIRTVTAGRHASMTAGRQGYEEGRGHPLAATTLLPLARRIVEDLESHRDRRFEMVPVISPDYLLGHLLNVAVLAVQLGRRAGLAHDRLVDLAAGGLVLDLGMLAEADTVRRSPGPLSPEDRRAIHQHPVRGVACLGESVSAFT